MVLKMMIWEYYQGEVKKIIIINKNKNKPRKCIKLLKRECRDEEKRVQKT